MTVLAVSLGTVASASEHISSSTMMLGTTSTTDARYAPMSSHAHRANDHSQEIGTLPSDPGLPVHAMGLHWNVLEVRGHDPHSGTRPERPPQAVRA